MIQDKAFAKLLRQQIDREGITQEDLAKKVGTSQANISRYISGNHVPRSSKIIRNLSKALNVDTEILREAIRSDKAAPQVQKDMAMAPDMKWVREESDFRRSESRYIEDMPASRVLHMLRTEVGALAHKSHILDDYQNLQIRDLSLFSKILAGLKSDITRIEEMMEEVEKEGL